MIVVAVIPIIVINVMKIASPPIARDVNTSNGINIIIKVKILISENFFKVNFCLASGLFSFVDIFIT